MKKRPLVRLAVEVALLLALYAGAFEVMARARVVERLLAPGSGQGPWVGLAVCFLLLRFFVVLALPGWVLARVFLALTAAPAQGAQAPGPDVTPA